MTFVWYSLLFILFSEFVKNTAVAPAAPSEGLPPSLERIGNVEAFPNEYPGQVYAFNWCLNGDGVTPINKSAFRITKPLDLKVAGLQLPKKNPLVVRESHFFSRLAFLWLHEIALLTGHVAAF